jgi:hypothetical protein
VQYSDPPNTEPRSVFRFDFMPVLGIWIPDRSKTGHSCPVASLDHFIKKRVIKIFFSSLKWSRLAVKNVRSGFQNRKPDKSLVFEWFLTEWPPKPFKNRISKVSEKWPFENWTARYSVGHCTCFNYGDRLMKSYLDNFLLYFKGLSLLRIIWIHIASVWMVPVFKWVWIEEILYSNLQCNHIIRRKKSNNLRFLVFKWPWLHFKDFNFFIFSAITNAQQHHIYLLTSLQSMESPCLFVVKFAPKAFQPTPCTRFMSKKIMKKSGTSVQVVAEL